MTNYVDSCLTYTILLQDSGLLPPPRENWNTFVPHKDDLAHVDEDNSDYEFDGKQWVKIEKNDGSLNSRRHD